MAQPEFGFLGGKRAKLKHIKSSWRWTWETYRTASGLPSTWELGTANSRRDGPT
jgi:hypothetical protein